MNESRLPRVCLFRDLHLFLNTELVLTCKQKRRFSRFNWVYQFNTFLSKIDEEDMWYHMQAEFWEAKRLELTERLTLHHKNCVLVSLAKSKSIQVNLPRLASSPLPGYLATRCK